MEQLGQVLTLEEACAYLKIPKSSLYKLAKAGRIPCQKVGRHWRFSREAVDRWLAREQSDQSGAKDHFEASAE
jgi:excisionase family DNA binding protein